MKRAVCLIALLIVLLSQSLSVNAQDRNPRPVIAPENAGQLLEIATLGRGTVQDVAWSPDDTSIAIATPGGVWLYDPDNFSAEPHLLAVEGDWLYAVAYSRDGSRIAAIGRNGRIYLWEGTSGDRLAVLETGAGASLMAFSPDGAQLAVGFPDFRELENNWVEVWNLRDTARVALMKSLPSDSYLAWNLEYSPDGKTLAVGKASEVDLWDIATWTKRTLSANGQVIRLAYHPNGETLAVGTFIGLRLYDTNTLIERDSSNFRETYHLADVTYSADGRFLAVGGNHTSVFEATTGAVVFELSSLIFTHRVILSPDGSYLITIGNSGVQLCDVRTSEHNAFMPRHQAAITAIGFTPPRQLTIGTRDGTLSLWEPLADQTPIQIAKHDSYFTGTAINENGTRIAFSDPYNVIAWDVVDGRKSMTPPVGFSYFSIFTSVALNPDGTTVAAGSRSGEIYIWDVASGERRHEIAAHNYRVHHLAFSPDGSLLASSSLDETLSVWDVATGEQRATVYIIDGADALAWSPDGSELSISAFGGAGIITWATDQLYGWLDVADSLRYIDHPGGTHTLAYSPGGRLIAADGPDDTFFVWDIAGASAVFTAYGGAVQSLAFSADGTLIATGGADGIVRVWRVP